MRGSRLFAASLALFFVLALAATPVLASADFDSSSGSSSSSGSNSAPVQAVPEPTALLAFGLGAAGVAWTLRRRKNR